MKIPYNVVHVSGSVLFAARGGKIHSFSLDDGAHLSTWKHPDVDKVDAAVKAISDEASSEKPVSQEPAVAEGEGDDEPPAKRQKVEEPKDEAVKEAEQAEEAVDKQASGKKKGGKKSKNRNQPRSKEHNISRVPDRPVITHLTSTSDGSHVLAITGHDKAIWVFESDGKGNLAQLSKRYVVNRENRDVAFA